MRPSSEPQHAPEPEATAAPSRELLLAVPLAYVGLYWLWLAYLWLFRGEAVLATRDGWAQTGRTSMWLVLVGLWGAPVTRWLWRRILAP